MNNEPVAWMDKRTNKCVVFINTPPSNDWIPLYTHPAKEKGLPPSNPLPMNQAYLTRSDNYTPIAWSCWSEVMQAAIITAIEPDMYSWQSIIPLFSHPADLTDEEIYKLAGEFWIDGSFDDGELDYVGFARAILKKASEK